MQCVKHEHQQYAMVKPLTPTSDYHVHATPYHSIHILPKNTEKIM